MTATIFVWISKNRIHRAFNFLCERMNIPKGLISSSDNLCVEHKHVKEQFERKLEHFERKLEHYEWVEQKGIKK